MRRIDLFKNEMLSVLPKVTAEIEPQELGSYPVLFSRGKWGVKVIITPSLLRMSNWRGRARRTGQFVNDAFEEAIRQAT